MTIGSAGHPSPRCHWREMYTDEELQARWNVVSEGCPFQITREGTCGNSENQTPECTIWMCPVSFATLMNDERCNFDEAMRQYDIQQARACKAEADLAIAHHRLTSRVGAVPR